MGCRFCGAAIPEGSRFCNKCGKSLGEGTRPGTPPGSAGMPPPLPPPLPGSAKPPPLPPPAKASATRIAPAPESELWRGTVSARSMIGSFAVSLLWAAGVLAAIIVFPTLRVRPVLYVTAAAAILPFCYVYFVWGWEKLRLRYRLTTVRLVRREGVVFRREQELELAQVGEVEVEQAMMDRLFNAGTVVVHARDGSDPAVRLEEIDRPHDVKDRIRTAALHRRKGVVFVEKR